MNKHARSAIRKATLRLIPFLCVCYAINFLDRVNIGFAALAMNADLGFTAAVFGFGAGIFFVGYILFEVPSNLMLQRFGARLWIARIMISWGLISAATALVWDATSFYAVRLALGIAEAGFFPGIILYLTYWFPARDRARIVSTFMAAIPLATVVGAPLSGALLGLDGLLGLKGWQWMFIIEGLPAVALGFVVLFVLPTGPEEAPWLAPNERLALSQLLADEAGKVRLAGYAELRHAFASAKVYVLGLLYFCIVIGLYAIGFWLPQVIQTFGLSHLEVGFVTAIPYVVASLGMILWGWHSDATGERTWHVALPLFLAAIAFGASAATGTLAGTVFALSLACFGIYAAVSTFWSFPTALMTGTAAAGGIALVNSIGNAGGFAGPAMVGWLTERTGDFSLALSFLAVMVALGGVLAIFVGLTFGRHAATIVAIAPASKVPSSQT
jgi:MFS transporter, ACS family, tartrate transporter